MDCFLITDIDGNPHVYMNKDGSPRKYHHIWQVKEWLNTTFGIDTDDIEITVVK